MAKRTGLFLAFMLVAGLVWSGGAPEETASDGTWTPTRPITLTVPFGAGGNADVLARAVAEQSEEFIGQPMGVVNRTGAGGVVAATEFLEVAPDGYNLITVNIGLMAIRTQTTQVEYEFADFTPIIGNIGATALVMVAAADSPIQDYESLLEYAQENTVNYGTFGLRSDHHMLQAALFTEMGAEASAVPFDSALEPLSSVLGGNIDVALGLAPVVQQFIDNGDLVPILTFNDDIVVEFDGIGQVPSAVDLGFDISFVGFNFYALPAGTPEEIVQFYTERIAQIYETPEIQELQARLGFVVDPLTPEEVATKINRGIEDVQEWLTYLD